MGLLSGLEGGSVRSQFERIRRRFYVTTGVGLPAFLALLLAGSGMEGSSGFPFILGAVVALFITAGYGFAIYRCPRCGAYPGGGLFWYPAHCQGCGVALL